MVLSNLSESVQTRGLSDRCLHKCGYHWKVEALGDSVSPTEFVGDGIGLIVVISLLRQSFETLGSQPNETALTTRNIVIQSMSDIPHHELFYE